jgi:hypothetical protein
MSKNAEKKEGDPILCNCGAEVGKLINVRGRLWLRVSGLDLSHAHGRCNQCLQIWHFDSSDIQLETLIQRVING